MYRVIFRKPRANHGLIPFAFVRGLGLVEVMISTFIISLVMIGVSRLHNTQVQITHLQERRLAAMALLDDKLADLRLIANVGVMNNTEIQKSPVAVSDRIGLMSKDVAGKATGMKGADPDTDSSFVAIGNDRGGALSAGEISYDQYTFQLHWTVAPLPEQAFTLLTVTVTWQDGLGKILSVSGSTVISASS